MSYSTILVPVDFSELNEKALVKAKELKEETDCKVILVHAVDYIPPTYVSAQLPAMYASEPLLIERAEEQMRNVQERAGLPDADIIVKVGRPGAMVLETQKEVNADLIVMAKHSQKGLQRMLGSTTNGVVNKTTCDLLVIPE